MVLMRPCQTEALRFMQESYPLRIPFLAQQLKSLPHIRSQAFGKKSKSRDAILQQDPKKVLRISQLCHFQLPHPLSLNVVACFLED